MKLKFNWGVGLTIFMVLFMTFILSIVIRTSFLHTDLYAEDYYQQELNYQEEIDAKNISVQFDKSFYLTQSTKEVFVHFDELKNWEQLNGKLYFYRPNNAELDRSIAFVPQDGIQLISKEHFKTGEYEVKLTWKEGEQTYQVEKTVYID
jgi:hypothetical protein